MPAAPSDAETSVCSEDFASHPDTEDEPQAAAPSQSQDRAWSPVSDDDGVEVDYGPDSGMDDEQLAEHYPPLNSHGQPHFPYEEDSEASYLAHPHTPPVHLPMLEGVQPAGYDYHYLGLGWGNGQISQGGEGSQHDDPLAAPV